MVEGVVRRRYLVGLAPPPHDVGGGGAAAAGAGTPTTTDGGVATENSGRQQLPWANMVLRLPTTTEFQARSVEWEAMFDDPDTVHKVIAESIADAAGVGDALLGEPAQEPEPAREAGESPQAGPEDELF